MNDEVEQSSDDAVQHLIRARAALERKRDALTATIAQLDNILADIDRPSSTMADAVREVMSDHRIWNVRELLRELDVRGYKYLENSVRSLLAHMVQNYELQKHDRGQYSLPGPTETMMEGE